MPLLRSFSSCCFYPEQINPVTLLGRHSFPSNGARSADLWDHSCLSQRCRKERTIELLSQGRRYPLTHWHQIESSVGVSFLLALAAGRRVETYHGAGELGQKGRSRDSPAPMSWKVCRRTRQEDAENSHHKEMRSVCNDRCANCPGLSITQCVPMWKHHTGFKISETKS